MDNVIDLDTGGRRKRGPNNMSAAQVNAELRTAYLTAFNIVGAQKYLVALARKHPGVFMQGLSKFMKAEDGNGASDGLTIVVQQLNVLAAPVPGVLNSPIEQSIEQQQLPATVERDDA